jgi:hypothetical protein
MDPWTFYAIAVGALASVPTQRLRKITPQFHWLDYACLLKSFVVCEAEPTMSSPDKTYAFFIIRLKCRQFFDL